MNLNNKNDYCSKSFKDLCLAGLCLEDKEFEGCTFKQCDFSEATFKHCKFIDCEFSQCNLSLLNIEYSQFSDVSFFESKLIGINWTKATWPSLLFSSPLAFYKSILNDSSFYALDLQEIVIEDCKAHHVDFREGNFSRANFTYTDFTESLFNKTNLADADFSNDSDYTIDIYENIIKGAKFSRFEAERLLYCLEIELTD